MADKLRNKPEDAPEGAYAEPAEFDELWRPDDAGSHPRGPERVLLESGQVTRAQIDRAVQAQADNPKLSVLEALVQDGSIAETDALNAVAEYFLLPFERVTPGDVDPDIFQLLPPDYIKSNLALPLRRDNEDVIVALRDPADIFLVDDLKRRIGANIQLVVTPGQDILQAVEELSAGPSQQVEEIIKDIAEDAVEVVDSGGEEVTDLERIAGESPVIRYVNFLVSSAVKDGASDIHIEPRERRLSIRCRIDGVLFEQQPPPLSMHAAVVSRLKIMANLDIAERRLPQDGRIRATVHGRTVDLRVSTLPTTHGEKCVIRILDNRSISVGLENLGMAADTLKAFRRQIFQPHGVVLVTGPTGSGKSTTLYSALQVMDAKTLNISTVEDPVEYELDTINQVNVHESIGMSFAAALRSLLRQDPDIIMVGEIRDQDTARIAVQASLTGHLVLSTLHTNDAPSSITRLIDIGIEPYLISASVNAVVAQRLVRRTCEHCKQAVTDVSETEAAYLKRYGMEADQLYKGAGCGRCRQTGYKGRLGLYELLEIDEAIREVVATNPSLGALKQASREHKMRTLREDGLEKIRHGLTTVEELMRVTETEA
ncbi:MAG: type II/IV secretion system protein [Phycisphaerae bacterium]|nr:type II/IV secretion system protein [Phycisphaerae bacterium]